MIDEKNKENGPTDDVRVAKRILFILLAVTKGAIIRLDKTLRGVADAIIIEFSDVHMADCVWADCAARNSRGRLKVFQQIME
jgi:hypothetical protein